MEIIFRKYLYLQSNQNIKEIYFMKQILKIENFKH